MSPKSKVHPPSLRYGAASSPKSKSQRPKVGSPASAFQLPASVLCFLAFIFCLLAPCAFAQEFSSTGWAKIGAGSSTSSNGPYTVSGVIGQHNAGTMSGGNYSLTGNFWAIFAVQTPGAPVLAVTLGAPPTVFVSWSLSATNFVLMQNSSLTTTNWIPSSYPLTTNGGVVSVTITSAPAGNLFFRLKQ